jgi:hypothetical protein
LAYTSTGQRAASLLYLEYTQVVWRHNSPDSAPLYVMSSRSSHFCAADDTFAARNAGVGLPIQSSGYLLKKRHSRLHLFREHNLYCGGLAGMTPPGCAWAGSLFGLRATTIEGPGIATRNSSFYPSFAFREANDRRSCVAGPRWIEGPPRRKPMFAQVLALALQAGPGSVSGPRTQCLRPAGFSLFPKISANNIHLFRLVLQALGVVIRYKITGVTASSYRLFC